MTFRDDLYGTTERGTQFEELEEAAVGVDRGGVVVQTVREVLATETCGN